MKIATLLAALLLILSSVHSQEKKAVNKIKYSSINQLGLLAGANKESFLVQTINGVRKDKWFAGIGAGIDFYVERGVPLFIDIRRDLSAKKNTPFLYADGGMYFPWLNFIQREQKLNSIISPGLYYDLGAGWKLTGKNKRGFTVSAGYSFKQVKEKVTQPVSIAIWPTPVTEPEYYNYKYRRLAIKLGFQL